MCDRRSYVGGGDHEDVRELGGRDAAVHTDVAVTDTAQELEELGLWDLATSSFETSEIRQMKVIRQLILAEAGISARRRRGARSHRRTRNAASKRTSEQANKRTSEQANKRRKQL